MKAEKQSTKTDAVQVQKEVAGYDAQTELMSQLPLTGSILTLPGRSVASGLRERQALRLQRLIGNRHVQGMLMRTPEDATTDEPSEDSTRVIHQNDTPIYLGPYDDVAEAEPLALLPRGTRITILDQSEATVSEVRVVGGPHNGMRGFINALQRPHISSQEYASLEELIDFSGQRGWHIALPQSSLSEGSITHERATTNHPVPGLGGDYPEQPQMEAAADSDQARARRLVIAYVRNQLSQVRIPTASGQMRIYRGGYVYSAETQSQAHEGSRRHHEFMGQVTLEEIGMDASEPRTAALWREFQPIIAHEGDTSAINAWDDRIVSIGAGFAGDVNNRQVGAIFNNMPLETRQRLYEYGIRVNDDDTFTVLDIDRGVVETGDNAMHIMQANQRMLGVLIQEAQSEQQMTQGESSMSSRQWMVRAQFQQFMERNRDVPTSVLTDPGWTPPARRFAFLLKHWMSGLRWGDLSATDGDVNEIASYALRRIRQLKPQWTEAYIQGRIRGLAADSGIPGGAINFQ